MLHASSRETGQNKHWAKTIHSPNLTLYNFNLWDSLKNRVYETKLHTKEKGRRTSRDKFYKSLI